MKKSSLLFTCCMCCSLLISCVDGKVDPYDVTANLRKKEYKEALVDKPAVRSKNKVFTPKKMGRNLSMSRLLVTPPPPPMGNGRLISISVTEDVPLQDVLIELGRMSNIDVEMDKDIEGGIILSVKDKPLGVVLDRICKMADLRYSYESDILRFENDLPYTKNYSVDYLTDGDLWGAIETAISQIISDGDEGEGARMTTNKPAGIISLYGDSKVQKKVATYLERVRQNVSVQVLIEAKIIEVTLNDEFSAGVNWDWTSDTGNTTITQGAAVSSHSANTGLAVTKLSVDAFGGSLDAAVNATRKFGTVKTISSPRITSINNQKASLSFINKLVYFTTEVEEEDVQLSTGVQPRKTFTSTKQEDEEGVKLDIVPSIDLGRNEITMNVKPELSVKIGEVEEPNPDLAEEGIVNKVPVIQTREISTIMKLKSGETMVMGGLMRENEDHEENGIPLLMDIPVMGWLFRTTTKTTEITETIIFVKATILHPDSGLGENDQNFYNHFNPKNNDILY